MKKRRLNILLVAIVALAAAPQALHDAQRLVNAAQERAADHFWSVFLSYQTPGAGNRASTQQVADNRTAEHENCALERVVASAERDTIPQRRVGNSSSGRTLQAAARTGEKADSQVSESVGPEFSAKELEGLEEAGRVLAREKVAARVAGLHSGETGRALETASKARMSYSFVQTNENLMKMREAMELDKLRRKPVRYPMDVAEPGNPPVAPNPNPVGSM